MVSSQMTFFTFFLIKKCSNPDAMPPNVQKSFAAGSALVVPTLTAATAMLQQVKGGEVARYALPGDYYHSPEFTGTIYIR